MNVSPPPDPLQRRLQVALALVAFVLFARLAVRHVGDSVFLADQADQLQNFEQLLRLEPDGLLGAVFQQTVPPTRPFGPIGAVVMGVPVALGLGIDSSHAVTSLLLVGAVAAVFLALFRLDARLAWCWLIALLPSTVIWWNAAMNWSNTILPSIGALALCAIVACLRRPTLIRFALMVFVACLGLQLHFVALPLGVAVAVAALPALRPAFRRPWSRRALATCAALVAVATGPYLLAELQTGFSNTRAWVSHAGASPPDRTPGWQVFAEVLQRAADPWELMAALGITGWTAVGVSGGVAAAALLLWGLSAWTTARTDDRATPRVVVWLVAASVAAVGAQALFFVAVNRSLLGLHYTSVLAPFQVVPVAALAAWLLHRLPRRLAVAAPTALGAACVVMLVRVAPGWAEDHWEKTDWTYRRISGAVAALCGRDSARTIEGSGFATEAPGHDGVLRYLLTRGFATCRFDAAADRLLAAGRDMEFPPVRLEPDGEFRLESVIPPGIASYRRVP